MKQITEHIHYIEASEEPLSADIVVLTGHHYTWIFDVGNDQTVIPELEKIPGEKAVVLSHFHRDHIGNLPLLYFDKLYQGKNTMKYTKTGTVVEGDLVIEDGLHLHLWELPNSHAKGSLALEVDDTYLFIGDGAYCTMLKGQPVYNAQMLQEEIKVLEGTKATYFLMSHNQPFCQRREVVLDWLRGIYKKRQIDSPYIYMEAEE